MKSGSKYYPLYTYLQGRDRGELTLNLGDIEAILQTALPASAHTQRSWWSNRSKGALQALAWIEAGYHVHKVDFEAATVTLRPFTAEYLVKKFDQDTVWNSQAIRSLRKRLGQTQAQFAASLGVRRQTVSEWENGVYTPERSTVKHLQLIAQVSETQITQGQSLAEEEEVTEGTAGES